MAISAREIRIGIGCLRAARERSRAVRKSWIQDKSPERSGCKDPDTRIFGPHFGSARKLRNLRRFPIVHCGEFTSNPQKVPCVPYCFYWLVAREGIEPPTRGFSVIFWGFEGFINQSLTALADPLPRHTKAQSWHTQSELVTFEEQGK
jgi:hypothetical protein